MDGHHSTIVAFIKDDKGYYHLTTDGATELANAIELCKEFPDDVRTIHTLEFLKVLWNMLVNDEHYEAVAELKHIAQLHEYDEWIRG